MKKGFLLTLDVFLALSLIGIVMLMVLAQDYSGPDFSGPYMRTYSSDMMAAFEKAGILASSVSMPSGLRQAINGLPPNICARLTILNSSDSVILDAQKEGCSASADVFTSYRSFFTGGELYTARSEMWSK